MTAAPDVAPDAAPVTTPTPAGSAPADVPVPPRTSLPSSALGLLLAGVVLLGLGGLALVAGGAIRWMGCLTPDTAGSLCPMLDDAFDAQPGLTIPLTAGPILVGLSGIALTAGLLRAAPWLGRGARAGLLLLAGVSALGYAGAPLAPSDSVPAVLMPLAFLAYGLPVLGILGLVLAVLFSDSASRADSGARRAVSDLARAVALALIAVTLGLSLFGFLVLNAFSNSHDSPAGLFLVQGVVAVAAAGFLAWATGRALAPVQGRTPRRWIGGIDAIGGASGIGGLLVVLAGAAWTAGGAIRWHRCLEPGAGTCAATPSGVALPQVDLWDAVVPRPDVPLAAGLALLVVGALLHLLPLALTTRATRATLLPTAALALLVIGAAAALLAVNDGPDAPVVFGELVLGVGVTVLGGADLVRAGRARPAQTPAGASA